jgi:hypothetical protein
MFYIAFFVNFGGSETLFFLMLKIGSLFFTSRLQIALLFMERNITVSINRVIGRDTPAASKTLSLSY